jgi:hypothetical protein
LRKCFCTSFLYFDWLGFWGANAFRALRCWHFGTFALCSLETNNGLKSGERRLRIPFNIVHLRFVLSQSNIRPESISLYTLYALLTTLFGIHKVHGHSDSTKNHFLKAVLHFGIKLW